MPGLPGSEPGETPVEPWNGWLVGRQAVFTRTNGRRLRRRRRALRVQRRGL